MLASLVAAALPARVPAAFAAALAQEGGTPPAPAEATTPPEPGPTAETTAETAPQPTAVATGSPAPTATQHPSGASALITAADSSLFPAVNAYVMVSDAAGRRVSGLGSGDFALSENGQRLPSVAVSEQDVGVQVVFVIDSSDAFSARDARGITRLEYIRQALVDFAQTRMKPGADDVTILAPEGLILEHSTQPAEVAGALQAYESNYAGVADAFSFIQRGLDYAAEPTRRPGMRRFVVYMSGGVLRPDMDSLLVDVGARASAAQMAVYTLFVGPAGSEETVAARNLQRLARAGGGERLVYSGVQSLAPVLDLLAERGRQYQLSYRSALNATGQHALSASVTLPGGVSLTSNEVVFPLRVEAPALKIGPLPEAVVRVAPAHDADPALADPTEFAVPVAVDFPDGHARALRWAELVVDDQVVARVENLASLEALTWPLAGAFIGGSHRVQARAVDELGLAAESQVLTVAISVEVPAAPLAGPAGSSAPSPANWALLWVALVAVLLAVALGLGVWWVLARRQAAGEAPAEVPAAPALADVDDEDTAPYVVHPPRPARPHVPLPHVPALFRPARPGPEPRGPAYLEVVAEAAAEAAAEPMPPIELAGEALVLGRDSTMADRVFADRSVSRRHARIAREGDSFRIYDEGSTSGTWLNYTVVPPDGGCELHSGDLINLGRVQLRFRRRDEPPASNGNGARVVKVTPVLGQPGGNGQATPGERAAMPAGEDQA